MTVRILTHAAALIAEGRVIASELAPSESAAYRAAAALRALAPVGVVTLPATARALCVVLRGDPHLGVAELWQGRPAGAVGLPEGAHVEVLRRWRMHRTRTGARRGALRWVQERVPAPREGGRP